MELGSYSFSALSTIQGITFRTLERFATTQIVETGLKVSRLIESIKKNNPDKVPKKSPSGLLNMVLPVNDFELALHLFHANDPEMAKIVKGAKGLPVLPAYLSILTNGAELLPKHLLESALSFSNASLSVEAVVAKLWNENLQTEIVRLAPLASTGLKFKNGRKKEALGPLTKAIRNRLKDHRHDNAAAVWSALSGKPPKGLVFCANRAGKYVEYDKRTHAGNLKDTGYRRFANIVTSEVKRLKSLTE